MAACRSLGAYRWRMARPQAPDRVPHTPREQIQQLGAGEPAECNVTQGPLIGGQLDAAPMGRVLQRLGPRVIDTRHHIGQLRVVQMCKVRGQRLLLARQPKLLRCRSKQRICHRLIPRNVTCQNSGPYIGSGWQ